LNYNNFNLLRLFAAIQVVLGHSTTHLLKDFGGDLTGFWTVLSLLHYLPGVPIFFLLSGFLISMSYDKNNNLKNYTVNRILRIYPALYVNIIVGLFILSYFGFLEFNSELIGWILAQISIVQFYNPEMFRGFGVGVINGALWTISVELIFYIVLPIIFYLWKKHKSVILISFFISYLLWNYDISSDKEIFYNKLLHVTIIPYLFMFLLGAIFYRYHENLKKIIDGRFIWWFILFVISELLTNYFISDSGVVINIIKWIIFSFMIFSFAFSFKYLSNFLIRRNDFTYGIYIYHMLIINVFVHLKMVGDMKYIAYVLALTITAGVISWFFIEKPFLRLKSHSIFNETRKKRK
jgi:peptidoglycan/LPS O-acetylase OafA/YrhL